MATVIRAEISENNKYWISKHRHYELKHFCLQYPGWKKMCSEEDGISASTSFLTGQPSGNSVPDPTAGKALLRQHISAKIDIIEKAAWNAEPCLYEYILKAVTEGLSYTYLKTNLNIPCSKDMYYDRYRRFFWLLSEARD